MRRLAITLSILGLIACGETETTPTGETQAPPPVSAAAEKAYAPEAAAPAAEEPAAAAQQAPEVASCLGLIGEAKFQEALPVCLAALAIDPDNQAVKDAVAQARSETMKIPGAGAATETTGEAAAQAGEAAKGLTGKLGQ